MSNRAPEGKTLLETALQRERALTLVLVLITLASWIWIVLMVRDMYGTMLGASAWMMTAHWDLVHLLLLWAMWAVMMTAMMLPSAAALVLLYAGALHTRGEHHANRSIYALAGGYLVVWGVFSAGAALLQRLLASALVLTPMMEPGTPIMAAPLLAIAGVYQLTPLKRACLTNCRSPLSFVMTKWREGSRGAFAMGIDHGLYCVGCCWMLMALLFVAGVMNLLWVAALAIVVLVEKVVPGGERIARAIGIGLVATGVILIVGAWQVP